MNYTNVKCRIEHTLSLLNIGEKVMLLIRALFYTD